ncbi:MAG: hypothetical protein JNL83_29885 [Myxococcales bacterium]|nr:hypothetical protein [Myxococcales bacterium]
MRALLAPREPQPAGLAFPARVTVRFANGATRTAEVDVPLGTFGQPSAAGVLRRKLAQAELPIWDAGMRLGAGDLGELISALPSSRVSPAA